MEDIDYERRFGGIARLYGAHGLARFQAAHVCVVGVGGVGSWVAEAFARSAIGKITLIDLDNVAESNINRQIQALTSTLGQAKVTALAERIAQINPICEVIQIEDFITPENLPELIKAPQFDYVVDAIDSVQAKTALLAYCRAEAISVVTIGGAGGRVDPGKIEIRDLCRTEQEPLLSLVRKRLRQQYGFPRGTKNKFGIDAVFSMEPLVYPGEGVAKAPEGPRFGPRNGPVGEYDRSTAGSKIGPSGAFATPSEASCNIENDAITGLNCAGFGSSMAVTASFGLHAAAFVLRKLAQI